MANIRVLQSSKGCDFDPDGVASSAFEDPSDQIIVRNKTGISNGNVINKFTENGKTVYELDDLVVVNPVVVFGHDAGIREVGEVVALVTFTGSINEGTYPITTRTMVPDEGLNLAVNPITFQKLNVTRTTVGAAEAHTLSAEDSLGNETDVIAQVLFKNAHFQGFNASPTLTEAQIKALVNKHLIDSLLTQYGGEKSYVVPGADPKYIYWCGPVGSTIIGGAALNGFALPLTEVGPVVVTNPHNGTLTQAYWVKRTSNKLDPGTYEIALS